LAEESRLAEAQIAKAEQQAELAGGWLDVRDLLASPEETAAHQEYLRWEHGG
jgi:hypothetical protein